MHTALIVSPPKGTAPAIGKSAHAVYEARLYNLAEFVDSSDEWQTTHRDEGTQGSFDLIILTKLGQWPSALDIDVLKRQYAKASADIVVVDWADLSHLNGSDLGLVLTRSRGGTEEDLKLIRSAVDGVAETLPGAASGEQQVSQAGGHAPVVVACDDQLLTLSTRRGEIDAQPATWGGFDIIDADDSATWAISADGRAAAVLHDGVVTPLWLNAVRGHPYLEKGAFPAQAIPSPLTANARLITLALLRFDVLRLSVADESWVWRLFIRPDGGGSLEVLASGVERVRTGIDLVDALQLFDEDGRRILERGPSVFSGITKIRSVDASVVGQRGLATVLGSDVSGPTLAIFRRRADGTWGRLDMSSQFAVVGINPANISDVRVERRLDDVEPRRLLAVYGGRVHVIDVQAFDAPTSSVTEAGEF